MDARRGVSLAFALVLSAAVLAGCGGKSAQQQLGDSVNKLAQADQATAIARVRVTVDGALVILDSDALAGASQATLVADTTRVITDLRPTSGAYRDETLRKMLIETAAASCLPCTHLVEHAEGIN